jgi:hypothetical protein
MTDEVRVKCPRCKGVFRERARRLTSGHTRQCSGCDTVIFFEDGSPIPEVKAAMKEARDIRRTMREEESPAQKVDAAFVFKRSDG